MGYFPFFVDLSGRKCLIVGGGTIALRKAQSVLEYGAVEPYEGETTVLHYLEVLRDKVGFDKLKERYKEAVELLEREFEEKDIEDKFFVVAATDDEQVNKKVSEICFRKNTLVNTVDRKEYCNFYFPSIIKDGDIVVGVSSGGNSPVLARELRKKIEGVIPKNLDNINRWLGEIRPYIKEKISDEIERKKYFEKIYAECEKKGDVLYQDELEEILKQEV